VEARLAVERPDVLRAPEEARLAVERPEVLRPAPEVRLVVERLDAFRAPARLLLPGRAAAERRFCACSRSRRSAVLSLPVLRRASLMNFSRSLWTPRAPVPTSLRSAARASWASSSALLRRRSAADSLAAEDFRVAVRRRDVRVAVRRRDAAFLTGGMATLLARGFLFGASLSGIAASGRPARNSGAGAPRW
jgi:hypothetical protein